MANVDNLNFKVILDDKDFSSRIEKDIELAKKLNTSLSSLLDAKRKVSNAPNVKISKADEMNVRRMAKMAESTDKAALAQQKLATESERTAKAAANASNAQERLRRSQMQTEQMSRRITNQTERQNRAYQSQSRILNELKGYALGYLSIHGASQLLSSLVRITGEFELQKTTLSAMLGDLNAAENIVSRIQGLAVESPFQFKELTTYAKQLSAFSVPAQELYDTTKMLADISAGLGVGMDRIVLAYGQVRSAAFLRGQEVRQFTEAGIPILNELAKQFSELEGKAVSAGEVFDKISARLVPFEMVAKVFQDMTSEGGKFYNMQEIQAETLRGKISNLKDAYEVMLNEIGKGQSENLKGAVDWARQLMQNYEQTGRVLVELVVAYGAYRAMLISLEAISGTFAVANHRVLDSFVGIGRALLNNPYAAIAAVVTASGFALYKYATELEGYEKVHNAFLKSQDKYNDSLASETAKLDALYAKLKLAKEGTDEYNEAKKQIYSNYASYISELKEEGVEVANLVELYDDLKIKIQEYTKAKFRDVAKQEVDQSFNEQVSVIRKRYNDLMAMIVSIREQSGEEALDAFDKEGLWQYITGDISTIWDMAEDPRLRRIKEVLSSKILPFGDMAKDIKDDLADIKKTYADDFNAIVDLYGEFESDISGTALSLIGGESDYDPTKKIQAEIDAVRKLKDAYDTLAPYMNGEMLRRTLTALFPNADQDLIRSLDFRGKLVELAAELNRFDQDASQKLLDSISGEKASEIVSAFKAIETYKNMLDSWLGEDFNLTGEGVSFDISKIIRDLNNQYAKINQKAIQANDLLTKAQMGDEAALKTVREVYGEEVWQKYLVNGKNVIDELARREREEAKRTSEQRIKDTANAYVKEKLFEKNIDLSDFADKTTVQIRDMIERMRKLVFEIKFEMATLLTGGVSDDELLRIEGLTKAIEVLESKIADTGEELNKKVGKQVGDIAEDLAGAFSDIGDEVESLGDILDNRFLEKFGKKLKEYSEFAKGMTSSIKTLAEETEDIDFENMSFEELSEGAKGGILSIIASAITLVYNNIKDAIADSYEYQRKLTEAAEEYRQTLIDIRRDAYSGIFGTDEMGLAAENAEILAEAQKNYQDVLSKFNEEKFRGQKLGGTMIAFGKMSVADIMEHLSSEQGWDLYLANGQLNIDAMEAYYDAYADRLTKKQRAIVDEIIASGNAMEDAMTKSAEYLTSLFSGVADNIAESMIDAFLESGDAAIDMSNIISDVSRQMVVDLIKQIHLMPILSRYADEMAAIDSNTALDPTEATKQKLSILESALSEIAGKSEDITETIERFEDYLGVEEAGSADLGEGIKGITEDQANLLASYLNAIRADVSYSKTLWVKMDANLQRIADLFTSSPTLMEYQAQIAANTYNTSIATQEILAELRGVVTSESGDSAIRVYS